MNKRNCLAALSAVGALIALFFKLPGFAEISKCASCNAATPYLPMLGASYFAFLAAFLMACRRSIDSNFAKIGLIFAIGLFISLSYLNSEFCPLCIVAHTLHIIMWTLLAVGAQEKSVSNEPYFGLKLSFACTSAIAVMALFSSLNITLALYGLDFRMTSHSLVTPGTSIGSIQLQTVQNELFSSKELTKNKAAILNFVSSSCPHCKEQLTKLNDIASKYTDKGFRFIAISRDTARGIQEKAPNIEWAEDPSGTIGAEFGVHGFPTMVILDPQSVVVSAMVGVPSDFENALTTHLEALK